MEQAAKFGTPLPPVIRDAPDLRFGLELFYTAFFELSSCRTIGMSDGPIPWLAIDEYCKRNEIGGEQRDALFHHTRAMDIAYLKHQAKQSKSKSK